MIRTQVQLTAAQDTQLQRLAAARGVSKAQIVRHALDSYLQRAQRSTTDAARKRRLMAIVGAFRSSGGPVAEQHDRYLAGAYAAGMTSEAAEQAACRPRSTRA